VRLAIGVLLIAARAYRVPWLWIDTLFQDPFTSCFQCNTEKVGEGVYACMYVSVSVCIPVFMRACICVCVCKCVYMCARVCIC